jgi:PEP-CTERM putative exosortase interaction domain
LSSLPGESGTYSFGFATGNTSYAAAVFLQASGGGFQIGVSNRTNSTPVFSSTVYSLGETVFLVGSYQFNAGTGDDVSSLWINPSSSTFGKVSAPTATLTATGGADMGALSQFILRGGATSPAGTFDELRIGTSWADVTPAAIPEPSTYAAIVGALALGVVVYVRRRRASAA